MSGREKKRLYLKMRKNNTSSNELTQSGIFDLALGQRDRQGDLWRSSESLSYDGIAWNEKQRNIEKQYKELKLKGLTIEQSWSYLSINAEQIETS